ncbi:MAG: 30S ribosomal protein S2 [Thermodesulfobacteriota bacterium]|nr:30S ribosomal protein S2 [Thermodesulfobacteriota bacterium]
MSVVTMKQLLEAGVHFGHQTKRWNPKMKPYIFSAKNGIFIIDLQKTVKMFNVAYNFIVEEISKGKDLLFIGTKKQAHEAIQEEAKRCGMSYINKRWLGGTLTNFQTIRNTINRLKELEKMEEEGYYGNLTKKEILKLEREREKLERNIGGIKNMTRLPGIVYIVDTNKEIIAARETRKVGIPTIALVDTNCDPDEVTFPIPANDDAIRAVKLFTSLVANACIEGKRIYEEQMLMTEKEEESAQDVLDETKEVIPEEVIGHFEEQEEGVDKDVDRFTEMELSS